MARKTQTVTIAAEGRDKGKVFVLTEMPASQAERWAARALLALGKSGVEIPDEAANAGMAAIAAAGIRAFASVSFDEAGPLLDEMMLCVQIQPDPAKPDVRRELIEDDIEEVMTRLLLRSEVVALHVGFSITDALSKLGSAAKRQLASGPNMPTSAEPSEPSSPVD